MIEQSDSTGLDAARPQAWSIRLSGSAEGPCNHLPFLARGAWDSSMCIMYLIIQNCQHDQY